MDKALFNRNSRRRVTLFITCLVISLATWLLNMLAKPYSYRSDTVVEYVNPPGNKAFHPAQSDTVTLTIQGSGWQMLSDKLRLASIEVDLKDLGPKNYITFRDQLPRLNQRLSEGHKILSVDPAVLYFDFALRSQKRVPVRLVTNIGFKQRFGVSADIGLQPAYVVVTGPASELARIDSWPTDSLVARNLGQTLRRKLNLEKKPGSTINVYPSEVIATVPVDEFTEKEVMVPLKVLNAGNRQVKLLPSRIRVTLLSSLKRFHDQDWEKMGASVDLADWTRKRYEQLPVRLVNVPRFGRVVKTDPQTIDFIVNN